MPFDRSEVKESPLLALARHINAACERHETDWRAGLSPRIENQLGRREDQDPPELLTELIALDLELRRDQDEYPTPGEYLSRFPGQDAAIAAAFGTSGLGEKRRPIDETSVQSMNLTRVEGRGGILAPPANVGSSHIGLAGQSHDFGDFELLEEVARGGMDIVYKARKRSLNCLVALKVMQAGTLSSDLEKRRFLLEAEVAANLDHPNIVPVYEIDRTHGLFFTMKWVEGGSLALQVPHLVNDRLAAARLLTTVARAVDDAHRKGYLHRDLKPTNILIDLQGKPYLTDFGLALRVGDDSNLTQPGAVLGTPNYMAPEQAAGKGKEVGPTADVYSLGAILYELLTGRTPFRAGTVMETLVLVLEKDPIPPSRVLLGVPPELEAICLKCLEKNPLDRYPSSQALAEELERFLRGEGVEAMRAGIWLKFRRWIRQEPQLVSRLLALGACESLTQINYASSVNRNFWLHVGVTSILAVWALTSVLLQSIARRDQGRTSVRPAWCIADAVFLTLTLRLLDAVGSSMIVGYPLLVAASGLWFRVGLVWLATVLAELGYSLLVLDAWMRGTLWRHDHHPNIAMATIAVTGFIVARHVNRLLVLSSYYENRSQS